MSRISLAMILGLLLVAASFFVVTRLNHGTIAGNGPGLSDVIREVSNRGASNPEFGDMFQAVYKNIRQAATHVADPDFWRDIYRHLNDFFHNGIQGLYTVFTIAVNRNS